MHEPLTLLVQAAPSQCLSVMITVAKPSAKRLEWRDLFSEGRRYYIDPLTEPSGALGFRMTCNSAIRWRVRQRSGEIAVLHGTFEPVDPTITRLQLHVRMAIPYLLDIFWIPLLASLIILPMGWDTPFSLVLTISFYVLSWIAHRANAQLQAIEMIYFVQRALSEFAPGNIPELSSSAPYSDFSTEWAKFYEQQTGEASS